MSGKASDDPRQVLAILNSLGVVGVTAPELKAFMKELKLYRKIKEQQNEQWKEETKAKILKRHQLLELHKTSSPSPRVSQSHAQHSVHKPERKRAKSARPQRNCLEVIIDRKANKQSVGQNKENDEEETVSTLAVSFEKCNTQTPYKKLEKTYVKQRDNVEVRPMSAPQAETKEVERPSRKRTKSPTTSRQRSKSMQLRSRSKSFIRSPQSRPESRASTWAKKGPSDPVALYNKYKSIWDQLSLPGEQSHAKLRWAVREKMLGSEPYPKPVVQYKRPPQTSSKGKRK